MKPIFANKTYLAKNPRRAEAGSIRIVILALVSFLLGVAVSAYWFRHAAINATAAARQTASQTANPSAPPEPIGLPAPAPAPATTSQPAIPQPINPAVIDEVKKAVPNYASISLNEGEQALRAAALKDFAAASAAANEQMQQAQQQLQNAQNNGSEADQQAAMKHVQDTQAAAAEKLKQIAANLQDQIAALERLKR